MKGGSGHRILALLLAVLLGLGASLSFVEGSMMVAEMAVAADGAPDTPNDCDGCGGNDHKKVDPGACLTLCGFAYQGVLPGEPIALPPASRASFRVARLVVDGRSYSPDHRPPKIVTLG